jgi:hypothetical protein
MTKSNPSKPPRFIVFAQERSSGKTLTAQAILSFSLYSNYRPIILQNDQQTRLMRYGEVHTIPLAGTNEVMENDMSDIDRNGIVLELIDRLKDEPDLLIAYDMQAGSVARLADIFDALGINERLLEIGETALVIVPVTTRTDVATGSLFTIEQFGAALPDHAVMPIISYRDGTPADLSFEHPYHDALKAAKGGTLDFPAINKQTALLFERMDRTLHEVVALETSAEIKGLAAELSTSAARATFLVATCRMILTGLKPQAERLGFRLGR